MKYTIGVDFGTESGRAPAEDVIGLGIDFTAGCC